MNELDLLEIFYDVMKNMGVPHDQVFLSIDMDMLVVAQSRFGEDIHMKDLEHLADICLANEWLERTTADKHYHFLSMTAKGLDIIVVHKYKDI